jgi:ABC-type Mn2+/Zn2+ transport system ATPase subunit
MNPSESDAMTEQIRSIRDSGVAVGVVEHDMRLVRKLCDRLVCMNLGQKLCEGSPTFVTSHPEVHPSAHDLGPNPPDVGRGHVYHQAHRLGSACSCWSNMRLSR